MQPLTVTSPYEKCRVRFLSWEYKRRCPPLPEVTERATIEGIPMESHAIMGVAGASELGRWFEIVKIPGGLSL